MNLLFIYSRNIHQDDSGASRTIILINNYLASQDNFRIFTAYRHLSKVDERIIECPVELTSGNISALILEKEIDILVVPEGELLTNLAHKAVAGTTCKVVTQFHSKPDYQVLGLRYKIWSSTKYSFRNRVTALLKLLLYPLYKSYVYKKMTLVNRQVVLFSDRFVVLADSFIEEYKQTYKLPEADNIVAIGNALSFRSNISRSELQHKEKTILVVSRLDEASKRISIAIKAWSSLEKKFPDWKMQIVGGGESADYYKKLVKRLNLKHVSFTGQQEPERYYIKASIFLMTSAYEGWGMTLTEALQKGCVPVAMNSYSALSYIVNDSIDGFITPNNDIKEFVDKLQLLIVDDVLREKMAWAGVENCQRFSVENIGKQWVELYESLKY